MKHQISVCQGRFSHSDFFFYDQTATLFRSRHSATSHAKSHIRRERVTSASTVIYELRTKPSKFVYILGRVREFFTYIIKRISVIFLLCFVQIKSREILRETVIAKSKKHPCMHFCESGNLIELNRKDSVDDHHSASCMCRLYSTYVSAPGYISNVLQEALLEESFENLSLNREKSILCVEEGAYPNHQQEVTVTAREVLLRKCGQTEPLPFEKCYPNSVLQHCQKIGEGVYGEVFLFRRPTGGGTSVIKVIPIEGSPIVNGERQKKFEEILSEITIAMELSDLRTNARNRTSCYSELRKVTCVRGKYPDRLIELWELWEESRGSDNDHPEIFDEDQLYVVLELANGGNDMESFVFKNAQQAYALVTQIACALAVGESQLQFEHRDLHWGNVLISNADDNNTTTFTLDGKEITLDTYGIQVAIIDFTLSRINLGGDCIYNDLALDPDQFTASGDYQFELYRLMQQQNGNNWQHYEPYTNILWLNYIIDKAITSVRYRKQTSKVHAKYIRHLKELKSEVLCYKSAKALVIDKFLH